MMLSDVCLSDVCRLHLVGRRRVRPAGWMARIGWSGPARPGSRLPLRASVAGRGWGISWRPPARLQLVNNVLRNDDEDWVKMN